MRPDRRRRGEQVGADGGFSLIELLVTMTVAAIATIIIGGILVSAFRSTRRLEGSASAVNEARLVSARIDRDLRSAVCISSPAENESGATLTFRTLSNNTLRWITYAVSGSQLTRQEELGTPVVVAQVGDTSGTPPFAQRATPLRTVEVRIPITSSNGGTFTMQTTVAGRNTWRSC